jgi:hypothetical protein
MKMMNFWNFSAAHHTAAADTTNEKNRVDFQFWDTHTRIQESTVITTKKALV